MSQRIELVDVINRSIKREIVGTYAKLTGPAVAGVQLPRFQVQRNWLESNFWLQGEVKDRA